MKPNLLTAQLFKDLPGQCQCKVTKQLHTAWAGLVAELGWAVLGWLGWAGLRWAGLGWAALG